MRLLILALLVATAVATTRRLRVGDPAQDSNWEFFKSKYNKGYGNDVKEESIRRLVWEKNMAYVDEHNAEYAAGKHTFWLAENEYADLSIEEFRVIMNGYVAPTIKPKRAVFNSTGIKVPASVDWRNSGIVTPVKNQGQCGSCWSFATTGAAEGQHALATRQLVSLSEQNLVDCVSNCNGCGGGWPDYAFQYIIQNNGVDTEDSYPYQAVQGYCQFNPSYVGATLSNFQDVAQGDENALMQASGSVGPIAVAIDASHQSFQMYGGGIYYEPACSSQNLDHAVLVVGYGSQGNDYWLVKNSWGSSWGLAGYIMMIRNYNNHCGIATSASFPIV